MAPELALSALKRAPENAVVLDPMCGSGTVLQHAQERGMFAYGYDIDPLAILVTRVTCTRVDAIHAQRSAAKLVAEARSLKSVDLPWIDSDPSTAEFIDFWFHGDQQEQLRRLSALLYGREGKVADLFRVAFSRTIITKDAGASRARDVSHSRPHRVRDTNPYDVYKGFLDAVRKISVLVDKQVRGSVSVHRRDARRLPPSLHGRVDLVVTSPPYLNAIDYMRGHRLSLVWLGHRLNDLSSVRSNSVGAERSPDKDSQASIRAPKYEGLTKRQQGMLDRYAADSSALMAQLAGVLSPQGEIVLVVGDSTLNGACVRNSLIVQAAAEEHGLALTHKQVRPLPTASRYLPPPASTKSALARRMRDEVVMRFTHATADVRSYE